MGLVFTSNGSLLSTFVVSSGISRPPREKAAPNVRHMSLGFPLFPDLGPVILYSLVYSLIPSIKLKSIYFE